MIKYIYLFSIILLIPRIGFAITPNEVYSSVEVVVSKIEAIRSAANVSDKARVPGIQVGKKPSHAYGKAIELLEKISRFQAQKNIKPLILPNFLNVKVKPENVLELVQLAEKELLNIIEKQGVTYSLKEQSETAKNKTPSDVYELIWQASYLMDTLIPAISPADVLRNVAMIEQGLVNIAKAKGKSLTFPDALTFTDKKPVDVSIQLYKLLYTIAKYERKIGMAPLIVPTFPAGKIKPEDTYDVTGNVLADLARISAKLKIPAVTRSVKSNQKITPNHVYAQTLRINTGAQQLLD